MGEFYQICTPFVPNFHKYLKINTYYFLYWKVNSIFIEHPNRKPSGTRRQGGLQTKTGDSFLLERAAGSVDSWGITER